MQSIWTIKEGWDGMATRARLDANARWQKKAYFTTIVRFYKDDEDEIRKYAGESLNNFIVMAVKEKIERIKKDDK